MSGNGRADRIWDEKYQKWMDVGYLDAAPRSIRQLRGRGQKPFVVEFVILPNFWIEQLKQVHHAATYALAHHILREEHKRKHGMGLVGEIVLSDEATGLARSPRRRAIKNMIDLGLMQVRQRAKQAPRVARLFLDAPKPKQTNGGG